MYKIPNLVIADKNGNVYDHHLLKSAFKTNIFNIVPYELEMIPLPQNSKLKTINGIPYAYDQNSAKIVDFGGGLPVYTELPPGYLRTLMISFIPQGESVGTAYSHFTPIGWMDESFVVPAIMVEEKVKVKGKIFESIKTTIQNNQNLRFLNNSFMLAFIAASEIIIKQQNDLENIKPILSIFSKNNINHVVTVKNFFNNEKIKEIKNEFLTINLNITDPNNEHVKKVNFSDIDSISIDIESFNPDFYFKNRSSFDNIIKLLEMAEKNYIFTSLNLKILPGFTDSSKEFEKMTEFINAFKINYLKLRHMAVEPDSFFSENNTQMSEILGLKNMLKYIKKKMKGLKIGFFSRTKDEFYLNDSFRIK
ncbi:MAG: hypothetical protein LDL13_09065 [Calditerrivibrio sp.]|nr:hypothetical protein [Calditerrivibrio sp.]MCA1980446.1 hypothetical protein [Calditerrivibrio sp.]